VFCSTPVNGFDYVQPRTRKKRSNKGIGIPNAHSKIQPIAPFSSSRIFIFPPLRVNSTLTQPNSPYSVGCNASGEIVDLMAS
jgi:hypothetical protein